MAFAGRIAPRRNTTTYGKPSRRLIASLSSATEIEFTQEDGGSMGGLEGKLWHRQGEGKHASAKLVYGTSGTDHLPEALARQAQCTRLDSRNQHRSSPSHSDFAKDASLYDVSPSDDGLEYNSSAARKKRKFESSKVVAETNPPVYDDESLQRHITAETRGDEEQISSSPSITPAVQDSNIRGQAVKSHRAARGSPHKAMSETLKDSTPDPRHNGIDGKAVEPTEAPVVARKQSTGPVRARIASCRMQNAKSDPAKTTARPTTPDTGFDEVYPQESRSDRRSLGTSRKSVYQPTTPPRPTCAAGAATTPRQRELWKRLLVGDAQLSPSGLDLPGLKVTEKRPEVLHGHAKSRNVSGESCQRSAALNRRPKKLIDTLHQSDQDRDHLSDEFDAMRESSSSDNKSEYVHSEVSAADGAITVQTSPGTDSQGLVSQFHDGSSNVSQTIPPLYGGGLKVTYARQRSYLTENDLEEAAMIGLPVLPEPNNGRGFGRRRLGDRIPITQAMESVEEEFGDLVDSQGEAMRSIHELREAGGNVRLVSELEAILDDIVDHQPGSISIRRSKFIELVTKLEQPANCRLFVDQGLDNRLKADVGLGNDLITNGLLVATLLQLMTHSSSTLLFTQVGDARVVRFLIELLGSDQDILFHARLRENNVSKATQADLEDLCSRILRSAAWRAGKPSVLSCHVLSLQCLEYLVRQARESGSLSEILSAHAITRIVATSVPPFPTPPSQPGEISVTCLELAVSILESCTISNAAECQASLWAGETLERVIGLLPLLSLWKGEGCGTSRTLTLRLYLNLTNNSPGLCEDFSTPEVISVLFRIVILHFEKLADAALEKDQTLLLDDLILSLGSLINLADSSKIARQLVMNLYHESQSYLDLLLELFMDKSKNAAEVSSLQETSSNVAFGWVSVLLGWLCLTPAIKARVRGRLPGNSLKQLLDAVDEFLRYHRRVDQMILRGEGEDDARVSFIGRLQSHMDDLKRAEGLSGTFYEVAGIGNS